MQQIHIMAIQILHPKKEEYPARFQDEFDLVFYPFLKTIDYGYSFYFLHSKPVENSL